MASNRPLAFPGTVRLAPGPEPTAGLVQAPGRVLVAPVVEDAQVVGQPKQEAQLLQPQVGAVVERPWTEWRYRR